MMTRKTFGFIVGLGVLFSAQTPPQLPHYLCAEKRSLRTVLLERWAPYEFPIQVHLPHPDGLTPNPSQAIRAVEEAFRRWQARWPRLSVVFVPTPPKHGIRINWFKHVYRDNQGRWGEAFLPQSSFNEHRQVRHWSEINLALFAHPGSAFVEKTDATALSERELRDLAIHEIGHALGLPHSDDGNDVMGGGNHYLVTELDMRNISARDVATLELIYSLPYTQRQHPCPGQEGR